MTKKMVGSATATEFEDIVAMFGEFYNDLTTAFLSNRLSLKYQQTTAELSKRLRQRLAKAYESAAEFPGKEALTVQAVAINLSKIFYDLLRLSGNVETKVREKIVFSEAATGEITEVMRRTGELFPHVADAVLTGNPLIVAHVEKEAEALGAAVQQSIRTHEDRLCKGICHPKASVIFMLMTQQVQDILWHCRALVSREHGLPEQPQ
jgi:Na+/phosphate symporter